MSKTFHFEGDLLEVLNQLEEVAVALELVLELLRPIVDGDLDWPLQPAPLADSLDNDSLTKDPIVR